MEIKKLIKTHTLACLAGGFAVGVAVVGVAGAFMGFSGSPAFCGSCHVMKGEAASFAVSSHRNQDCVECHLPHDSTIHYFVEKGRTGMIDTYHTVVRDYPAKIKLSEEGRKTVSENCLRCHQATMSEVKVQMNGPDSDCLKCHIRMPHGSNHLEGGINVE